jgi:hypothetical protein
MARPAPTFLSEMPQGAAQGSPLPGCVGQLVLGAEAGCGTIGSFATGAAALVGAA